MNNISIYDIIIEKRFNMNFKQFKYPFLRFLILKLILIFLLSVVLPGLLSIIANPFLNNIVNILKFGMISRTDLSYLIQVASW